MRLCLVLVAVSLKWYFELWPTTNCTALPNFYSRRFLVLPFNFFLENRQPNRPCSSMYMLTVLCMSFPFYSILYHIFSYYFGYCNNGTGIAKIMNNILHSDYVEIMAAKRLNHLPTDLQKP